MDLIQGQRRRRHHKQGKLIGQVDLVFPYTQRSFTLPARSMFWQILQIRTQDYGSRAIMVWLSPWRILRGSLPSYFPRLFPPLPGPFQQ